MMAIADSTRNPSTRRAVSIAVPLGTYLAESKRGIDSPSSLDADAVVRELVANAGILPDTTTDGCHVVMVALSPRLLEALAAHVPPVPQPMPLLEWRA